MWIPEKINIYIIIIISYIKMHIWFDYNICSSMVKAFAYSAMDRWIDPSLSYFLFQPVLHNWCNKGCDMYYPVCGMMHIKEPLLLIGKSSLCGGSRFPLLLSVCSCVFGLTKAVVCAILYVGWCI